MPMACHPRHPPPTHPNADAFHSVTAKTIPCDWGNESFRDLRDAGLSAQTSCYFSLRSRTDKFIDNLLDWVVNYIQHYIQGEDVEYKRGRRVSWADPDKLIEVCEYSEDMIETQTIENLVIGY